MVYWIRRFLWLAACSPLPGALNQASAQEVEAGKWARIACGSSAEAVTPVLEHASLQLKGRRIKARLVKPSHGTKYEVGGFRVDVDGNTVRCFGVSDSSIRWMTKTEDGKPLVWLGSQDAVAFLAGYTAGKFEAPLRVRRLDLRSGKWMGNLRTLPLADGTRIESVQALVADTSHVLLLTTISAANADDDEETKSYRVTCFSARQPHRRWTREFTSPRERTPPVVLLNNAHTPNKVRSHVQYLTWLGHHVLVCAGALADVVCLDVNTGQDRWRVPRIWELQRGFKGPSDWRHFFMRSGAEREGENGPRALGKSSSPYCAIVGGPQVIPRNDNGHVFIAVARGPNRYGEYLADCIAYELDSRGKPLAMSNLPRTVRGDQFTAQSSGLVWACEGGAFVRLALSRDWGIRDGAGRGARDLLCRVDWYKQLSNAEPDASWLTTAVDHDPIAMGVDVAFRVCVGGYISHPSDDLYTLPISAIDLRTGAEWSMLLRIPFKGRVARPLANYAYKKSPDGKDHWHSFVPYFLSIRALEIVGKKLRVTLAGAKRVDTLEFDLGELWENGRE